MIRRAGRFAVYTGWKLFLKDMQIDPQRVLRLAELPADLFNRDNATLTTQEYFQLWHGVEQAAGQKQVPLMMAECFSAEAFDPPIFACLCSPDFVTAVQRLSLYKPLIGPMLLDIRQQSYSLDLTIECYGYTGQLPRSLAATEVVFFTQIARLATRERIVPRSVTLPHLPENMTAYTDYFGCDISQGDSTAISFSMEDARKPFLTSSAPMWAFFEEGLNKKLADLGSNASTTERVRAVLLEALPSGESGVDYVASKLAMNKRTLQRKLSAEAESFQTVLTAVRTELADHYLGKSALSLGEISFLLGFQEANSFIRAYRSWKGISPGSYREQTLLKA